MSTFDYINHYYGVNACVGRRVIAYGHPGTIVRDFGQYIGVVLDDDPNSPPDRYHPTDGIIYGDIVDYTPPKINARQAKAKRNWQEYLDADYGHRDFAEWLGINTPRVDYDSSRGEWRMYRYGNYQESSIYGEWCKTKKAAKASYKEALKKYRAK
ncbi:hypothetical protein [Pectobacterium carotovorum]|uniref:hypothetical protein n=1 Tax=Pectobacterium carotovorum TaxID=554 RepID=UPI001E45DC2D|nr:hypothetical protein [Pectobacterium carotovorum]UFT95023.1 hypothetical protein LQF52_03025 [Pectobacterium carotovorum]